MSLRGYSQIFFGLCLLGPFLILLPEILWARSRRFAVVRQKVGRDGFLVSFLALCVLAGMGLILVFAAAVWPCEVSR